MQRSKILFICMFMVSSLLIYILQTETTLLSSFILSVNSFSYIFRISIISQAFSIFKNKSILIIRIKIGDKACDVNVYLKIPKNNRSFQFHIL